MPTRIVMLFAFLILSNAALANVYKCKSASGATTFSDRPCEAGSMIGSTANKAQAPGLVEQNSPKQVYTKDMETMQSPDAATQACFNYINTTAKYPDPSTTKLLSSSRKTVAVKSVGPRQMLTIVTTSKNEAGMYVGKQASQCLLMGDGLTINTKPFELL